jgi:ApaG protein
MFYRMTDGIRVTAQPVYLASQSSPAASRYVFAYHMRIENVGPVAAQLMWRHWYIHDPVAGDSEVEGEGVIGQQPLIDPGTVHEYQSFCVLQAPEGSMEGFYELVRPDGTRIRAAIPRFELRASADEHGRA